MSHQSLAKAFEDAVLSFVWRQWGQLGVSAHVRNSDLWCQDPEALLVFSLEVARREPRMFDEILDWLSHNKDLLMRQRLENLLKRQVAHWDLGLVSASLETAGLQSFFSKKALNDYLPDDAQKGVFEGPYAALTDVDRLDNVFARHGLRRPPFRASGKSTGPKSHVPINFAFRMRALFGPSTRAEALRCLLLRPEREHGTAEVANLTMLSRVGVHQALDAIARAGGCETRQKGRKDLAWWVEGTRWWGLLQVEPENQPRWVDWPSVFLGLILIWRWLHSPEREKESAYLRASRARELAETVAPLLHDRGLPNYFALTSKYRGEGFWPIFSLAVMGLASYLESGMPNDSEQMPGLGGTHPVFIRQLLLRRFPWISDVEIYAGPYTLYYHLAVDDTGPLPPDIERVRATIEPLRLAGLRSSAGFDEPEQSLQLVTFPDSVESILVRSNPTMSGVVDSLNKLFPKARFVRIEEDFDTKTLLLFQDKQGVPVSHDEVAQSVRLLLPWAPFDLGPIQQVEDEYQSLRPL